MIAEIKYCPTCRDRKMWIVMYFALFDQRNDFWLCPLCGYVTKPVSLLGVPK